MPIVLAPCPVRTECFLDVSLPLTAGMQKLMGLSGAPAPSAFGCLYAAFPD